MIRSPWEDYEHTHHNDTEAPPATANPQCGCECHREDSKPSEEQLAAQQWAHLKKYYAGGNTP